MISIPPEALGEVTARYEEGVLRELHGKGWITHAIYLSLAGGAFEDEREERREQAAWN